MTKEVALSIEYLPNVPEVVSSVFNTITKTTLDEAPV